MNNNEQLKENNTISSVNNIQDDDLVLKNLKYKKTDLLNKLKSIQNINEILKQSEDELNESLQKVDKDISYQSYLIKKKDLNENEIIDELKTIRRITLEATIAAWLCWTGIGFFTWFFLEILIIQKLLKFNEKSGNIYLCTILSIFNAFFLPIFFNGFITFFILNQTVHNYHKNIS